MLPLGNKLRYLPCPGSVLPVTVTEKWSPYPYPNPWAFFTAFSSPCPFEEGDWETDVVELCYQLVWNYHSHPVEEASLLSVLTTLTRMSLLPMLKFSYYLKDVWCLNKYICISQTSHHLTCHHWGVMQHGENIGVCSLFPELPRELEHSCIILLHYLLHLWQIYLWCQFY